MNCQSNGLQESNVPSILFSLQKYTNLLNLFLSVVQKDSSDEVKNLATTLLKYHVLGSCKQLKIRPQDW